VPIPLIAVLFLLFYVADLYFLNHGGDITNKKEKGGAFPSQVYDPYDSYEQVEAANPVDPIVEFRRKGEIQFGQLCAVCHQATGQGLTGQFPPLAGSEWVMTKAPSRAIRVVLNGAAGPITVKGQAFNNAMPPWKDLLNDEQVAQILTYVRSQWGNNGSPVKPEEVKKWRDKDTSHGTPISEAELSATPEAE
jgi:mono/diheme cytochrome c family protein